MKRVLVVDDERPVVDHIVRLIDHELAGEFSVTATAGSGREALEKAPLVRPDIIVMDVRMPGLSGLDTIRELQKRGSGAAFILSTAYERFDIAREALELGITGYLLKPVVKDTLVQALRNAAAQIDRRSELELKEFDFREKDRQVRGFVEHAFLASLMLGRSSGDDISALRSWLGLDKPWGLVAAAAFLHRPQEVRRTLEATLLYKSEALCGPMVSDRCLIFLSLSEPSEADEAERALMEVLRGPLADDLVHGALRIGFADPRPLDELASSWPEALGRLSGRKSEPGLRSRFASGRAFEAEGEFQEALAQGDPERLRTALDALLAPWEGAEVVAVWERYRVVALLGSALGRLVGLGLLDESSAQQWMDFDDLCQAPVGRDFCALARLRLPVLAGAAARSRRGSVWVAGALEFIRENYTGAITLDSTAAYVGLSPKRLSRLFIEELGQGFSDYLIDFRIEKAKKLLALPGMTVKQVSTDCGYPDPNYFARLFKKVTGVTPSEFAASP